MASSNNIFNTASHTSLFYKLLRRIFIGIHAEMHDRGQARPRLTLDPWCRTSDLFHLHCGNGHKIGNIRATISGTIR